MYKALCVAALLLTAFVAVGSRSAAVPAATLTSPQIVAKVSLTGQTQTIPTTTLFNVKQTGLYRVTTYSTQTVPGSASGEVIVAINYTDGAGAESYLGNALSDDQVPPSAYGTADGAGTVANSFMFNAVSGTPISFEAYGSVEGTYDVFIVVERLT
jgi:hypothetical protein